MIPRSESMDSVPVNWESLDALITDFARSENLIEDSTIPSSSSPPSTPCSLSSSSTSYQSRLINRKIRKLLEAGNVVAAIDLLRSHAPTILKDDRILFRLQKQKFIELLRKGTPEDRSSAIECLRTDLAPCALNASPEAYEEFKHILLAFIYDKDDQTSPVANEWSEKRRADIAGFMSSVVRAHLHAYDPVFSMTLRYLMSIHKEYCFRQGVSSPISDLTERLLLEERDSPATLQESFYEAPPFDEVDIQALAHAVELTRQGAIDSLRFAKGDLFLAFQNELCRMRLDMPMLDSLVREYCVYRGIVDSGTIRSPEIQIPSEPWEVHQPESNSKPLKVNQPESNSEGEITSIGKDICTGMETTDSDLRYGGDSTSNPEICSTSGSHQSYSGRKSRSCKFGDRGKRKRWRGRSDEFSYMSDVYYDECSKEEVRVSTSSTVSNMSKEPEGSEKQLSFDIRKGEDKYEFVLEMKYLASRGMAAEVVDEVNSLDPNFFVQNRVLLFQLKQVEFLNLVNSGDHTSALNVACSHLGPLAAKDPALLKPLKETLLTLIQPTEEALQKCLPLDALSTSLQVAIGRRLGIEEPQLMKIMRATLHTHSEWFKLQMCKDGFERLLKIDALKDVSSPMMTAAAAAAAAVSKSNNESCTHGSVVTTSSSGRMGEDGGSPTQVSSTDAIYDETAILKVMEFLALPRADAIHLLGEYDGSAETVIQQLFA